MQTLTLQALHLLLFSSARVFRPQKLLATDLHQQHSHHKPLFNRAAWTAAITTSPARWNTCPRFRSASCHTALTFTRKCLLLLRHEVFLTNLLSFVLRYVRVYSCVVSCFIELLRAHHQGHLPVNEVVAKVAYIFAAHGDLLEEFASFLPGDAQMQVFPILRLFCVLPGI